MLTTSERRNLNIWKVYYSMEAQGFTRDETTRLVFLRWLYHARQEMVS